MVKVKCISMDSKMQLIVGKIYYIDIISLYGDIDGDWYVSVIECNTGLNIGRYKLCHFKSML